MSKGMRNIFRKWDEGADKKAVVLVDDYTLISSPCKERLGEVDWLIGKESLRCK